MTHVTTTGDTAASTPAAVEKQGGGLDFFGRYLSLWVALCIVAGVAQG